MEITKRINFFDGLFLRQEEFLAEQLYHLHMRRRMNFMLFDGSGVVQAGADDLRITPTSPPADKTFHVNAGMAISHRSDLAEGREIIRKENTPPLALALDQAFVAIHYEEALIEPQTGIDPNTETRVEETAVVTVHDATEPWPPPASLPDGEQYVLLGRITRADMTVDESQRQTALLRSGLIGVTPSVLMSIEIIPDPASVPVGGTLQLIARGTFSDSSTHDLSNAVHSLTWTRVGDDDTIVTVDTTTGVATGVGAGSAQITAQAQGKSDSVTVTVSVPVPAPSFNPAEPFAPTAGFATNAVRINGDNFDVDDPAPPQVFFGTHEATANISSFDSVRILVTVPGTVGTTNEKVPVKVITSGGEASSANLTPAQLFELNPAF
ncbi:MAG: hypothetical protein GY856_55755 [bacterium]|nr:hypothetical protein [bacterium]